MANFNAELSTGGNRLLNASSEELSGLHVAVISRPDDGTVLGGACLSLIKRMKRSRQHFVGPGEQSHTSCPRPRRRPCVYRMSGANLLELA